LLAGWGKGYGKVVVGGYKRSIRTTLSRERGGFWGGVATSKKKFVDERKKTWSLGGEETAV